MPVKSKQGHSVSSTGRNPVLPWLHMIQTYLRLHRTQGIDYKTNVLVGIHAQLFEALPDVVSINRAGECLVLELLLD